MDNSFGLIRQLFFCFALHLAYIYFLVEFCRLLGRSLNLTLDLAAFRVWFWPWTWYLTITDLEFENLTFTLPRLRPRSGLRIRLRCHAFKSKCGYGPETGCHFVSGSDPNFDSGFGPWLWRCAWPSRRPRPLTWTLTLSLTRILWHLPWSLSCNLWKWHWPRLWTWP